MLTIDFIGELSLHSVLSKQSPTAAAETEVLFDLNGLRFAKPCGMATLACWVSSLLSQNKKVLFSAASSEVFGYLQNMNFFRLFNVYEAEDFNRHPQSGRFARVSRITISSQADQIAGQIIDCIQVQEPLVKADLFTCLEESISNLWAHARKPGFAVAQSYLRLRPTCRYEIAICDYGRGIRAALRDSSDYSPGNDSEALELACQKGVSSALYRHDRASELHFGLGLWQIDEIARTTGSEFLLCSGEGCRVRTADKVEYRPVRYWQGTIVSLKLWKRYIMDRTRQASEASRRLRFG